ncbi:MAG: tRNA (guanosine(37)-N1)-methyltransferase TrmD [Patescibacteria group bacterium]
MKKINFHIISLFPEVFQVYFNSSIIGRAQTKGIIKINYYQLRDFLNTDKDRLDGRPYGGGPGMVIKAPVVIKAVRQIIGRKKKVKVIFLDPRGYQFDDEIAENWSESFQHLVLVAGRYEGIDARAAEILTADKVSIGSYILSGGELPAMVVVDAVARRLPGVLGSGDSLEDTRPAGSAIYTRPEIIKDKGKHYSVPAVLKSGHHQKINQWKKKTNK